MQSQYQGTFMGSPVFDYKVGDDVANEAGKAYPADNYTSYKDHKTRVSIFTHGAVS